MVSCNVADETVSGNISYSVVLKFIGLSHFEWIPCPCTNLENTGLLNYEHLPNTAQFHYEVSKNHIGITVDIIKKSSSIGKMSS